MKTKRFCCQVIVCMYQCFALYKFILVRKYCDTNSFHAILSFSLYKILLHNHNKNKGMRVYSSISTVAILTTITLQRLLTNGDINNWGVSYFFVKCIF